MSSETYLNASEAAKATGKSVVTVRQYLASGKLPNAFQVAKGKVMLWQIPLSDLASAGLLDKVSNTPPAPSGLDQKELKETALVSEIERLESKLRHARELLARTDRELEDYRNRERQLLFSLETRQTQEKRRFSWFRSNP